MDAGTWALVLAAGEGKRLRSLTTAPSGLAIPKQYCALYDGPSLLHEALDRARSIAGNAHICTIVAEQHRRWWQPQLHSLPRENVIVQPANRGTAIGILLPLLHVLARDPAATLVILPSDHHFRHEQTVAAAMAQALEQLALHPDEILLLGLAPDGLDTELGYVLPGASDGCGALRVERFIEKPGPVQALELLRAGALWNVFILAARGAALLELFRRRIPAVVDRLSAAVCADPAATGEWRTLAALYEDLPVVDFSSDILAGQEARLRVLPVAHCGWTDLGTPRRVEQVLRSTQRSQPAPCERARQGYLSLAEQRERLSRGAASAPRAEAPAAG
jgi:mannose-1-phosphate guanylyltransferase